MARSNKTRFLAPLLALLFILPLSASNTPGVFRGVLIDNPDGSTPANFVFLRSRNGNIRKVDSSKAVVAYDESVPKEQQTGEASRALKPGTDVRVTAEQQADGEWHATRIEILGQNVTKQSMQDSTQPSNDDDDDDGGLSLQPYGSNRPVLRKS